MVSLISLATITMFSSVFISDLAEHDAAAVNMSGSLRMKSYRIVSEIAVLSQHATASQIELVQDELSQFDKTLSDNVMLNGFTPDDGSALEKQYLQVQQQWQQSIKPMFMTAIDNPVQIADLLARVTPFVGEIDRLVMTYQHEAESKIETLRIIQLVALFLTLILVYFSLHSIQNNIATPLKELTLMARKIGSGDFTHRVQVESDDELGLLASSFNHSCNAISQMYGNLEKRVEIKTKELRRSNRSIQLLYETVKKVNDAELQSSDFDDIIAELSDITSVQDIDLCLMTAQGEIPYEHIVSDQEKQLPNNCVAGNCNDCITVEPFAQTTKDSYKMKYPLVKEGSNFGVLVCTLPVGEALSDWQHQIIQSVADQIAVALSLKNQAEQDRRIALMDERTTIARELHDSLAQALSYLKIQVTRLQKSYAKNASPETIDEITLELKEGLSSAYRQLRELLTTFRLKIDTEGLLQALEETVKQHQERSEMNIDLNFNLGNIPLTPNEEIHLLQIIREATQNAVHHSKGNNVTIGLNSDENKRIHLTIKDDGVGIPDDPEKLNHYGLVIMKERSRHLNGDLHIANNAEGGACVAFSFRPDYVS